MFERLKTGFARLAHKALNVPLSSPAAPDLFGPPLATSGVAVDALAVLRVPAAAQGVRLISEAVATLDARLCRHGPDGRETVAAADHLVARALERPNSWTGETEFIRQLVADLLIWGNAYALVSRVRDEVREFHRIDPRTCSINIDATTGEPSYHVPLQSGGTREFSHRDVAHVRNLTLDGARGLGLVNLGGEAIALALLLEQHAAGMFARGARPGGVLEVPGKLTAELVGRLRESFSQTYAGAGNSGRTAILESGVKFSPLQISSVDAQFIECRKLQVVEIARLLNIPPVLLGDLEHATLANAEALAQQFLDRTIAPILELFEDAFERALLTEEERDAGYEIEFDTRNFVRADVEKRFGSYKSGIESGVLLLNEAREREGLAPVEGGDAPMRSVQTIPLAPDASAESIDTRQPREKDKKYDDE